MAASIATKFELKRITILKSRPIGKFRVGILALLTKAGAHGRIRHFTAAVGSECCPELCWGSLSVTLNEELRRMTSVIAAEPHPTRTFHSVQFDLCADQSPVFLKMSGQ